MTKKICPVCGKPYLKATLAKDNEFVDRDHYYHVEEKMFGIRHYSPEGLCVVGKMKMGKDIEE